MLNGTPRIADGDTDSRSSLPLCRTYCRSFEHSDHQEKQPVEAGYLPTTSAIQKLLFNYRISSFKFHQRFFFFVTLKLQSKPCSINVYLCPCEFGPGTSIIQFRMFFTLIWAKILTSEGSFDSLFRLVIYALYEPLVFLFRTAITPLRNCKLSYPKEEFYSTKSEVIRAPETTMRMARQSVHGCLKSRDKSHQ